MSKEIQTTEKEGSRLGSIELVMSQGPQLNTIADAWTLAQAYHHAGMTPKTRKGPMTANELMIVFMTGMELGFGPSWSLRNITTFNGQAMVHSDGPISLVLKSGLMEWQKSGYTGTPGKDDYTAWFESKRKGIEFPVRREFSIGDAVTAGLWGKDIWKSYGQVRMLLMRARAFGLRDQFADVLAGIGILEEHLGHAEVINEPEEATTGSAGLLNALRAPAESSVTPEPEPEAVEAPAPVEEGEEVTWESLSDEPTPEEIEEIRARELAEAQEQGLFGGAE